MKLIIKLSIYREEFKNAFKVYFPFKLLQHRPLVEELKRYQMTEEQGKRKNSSIQHEELNYEKNFLYH